MTKHTPGPWRAAERWEQNPIDRRDPIFWGYTITGSDSRGAPILPTLGIVQNFPNNIHANALLIASAPELLNLLRKLSNEVMALEGFEGSMREAIGNTNYGVLINRAIEAGAAIRKAEPAAGGSST